MALHLADADEPGGAHFENVVLHDLLAWRDARLTRAELTYWRTAIGEEVDFVIESAGAVLPIEVRQLSSDAVSVGERTGHSPCPTLAEQDHGRCAATI